MNSGQWERAWRIFNAAREIPQDQQRPFVDSECGNEPEVRERVLVLLDELTETPSRAPDTSPTDRTGTEVGRYRVAGLLGRGGVGEVYAARDSDLAGTWH